MLQRDYFLTLARYHRWANRLLLEKVDAVSDTDYAADQGLFFKSIHGTLNHILLVDRVWQGRITGEIFPMTGLDQVLAEDRHALRTEMARQADAWIGLITGLDEQSIGRPLKYKNSAGEPREYVLALLLAHGFNHGTHHRGQVTAALSRLGLPTPSIDLPYYLDAIAAGTA